MSPLLRTSAVFVPGKLPAHTYNPRDDYALEQSLNDYIEEAGSILTLAGPTKTGKTVLLRNVLQDPVWIDGQGIGSVNELWARIGDELGVYPNEEALEDTSLTGSAEGSVEGGVSFLRARGTVGVQSTSGSGIRVSADRSIAVVARDALIESARPLVIDDFHFVDQSTQRQIVRALKPLVLAGIAIIFVSISHRVREVVSAEPDMTGRVKTLTVQFWSESDLLFIAREGFRLLGVVDEDELLAKRLAKESHGSPHLMQQFCRELCKANGIRETTESSVVLAAPESWRSFFLAQIEDASKNWATRLLRGPQERGSIRTKYETHRGFALDGYGLALAAISSTGPKLDITKDEIREAISDMVSGQGPANAQTTNVLKNMSRIASARLTDNLPSAEELEHIGANTDVQPVIDFIDDGPSSSLHIADPFFAFYLAWGLDELLYGFDQLDG